MGDRRLDQRLKNGAGLSSEEHGPSNTESSGFVQHNSCLFFGEFARTVTVMEVRMVLAAKCEIHLVSQWDARICATKMQLLFHCQLLRLEFWRKNKSNAVVRAAVQRLLKKSRKLRKVVVEQKLEVLNSKRYQPSTSKFRISVWITLSMAVHLLLLIHSHLACMERERPSLLEPSEPHTIKNLNSVKPEAVFASEVQETSVECTLYC
ncbi:unnamed protein product [Gongylonema pulchrum]|uniref:60S ribosomal protein L35 n=1 Tax=Gongylonema pulchrum TaxID=637853 RepID=A0A183DUA8_9BILA|nr:unnamed protein product [Gongylonema pulchrum]